MYILFQYIKLEQKKKDYCYVFVFLFKSEKVFFIWSIKYDRRNFYIMKLIKIKNTKLYLTIFNLVLNRAFINREYRSEPTFFRVSVIHVYAHARVYFMIPTENPYNFVLILSKL